MTNDNDQARVLDTLRGYWGAAQDPEITHVLGAEDFVQHFIIPDGYVLEEVDLEAKATRPRRPRGTATLYDERSFTEYVKRFKTNQTVLFANPENGNRHMTAVFNYQDASEHTDDDGHEPGAPGWGDWRALLQIRYSQEWLDWQRVVGTALTQTDFAYHLEQRLIDVHEPPAADLMTIMRTLKISKDVRYERVVHLQTGASQLVATTQYRGQGADDLELPESIVLRIPIFEGGEPEPIEIYLRYRLSDEGQVVFALEYGVGTARLVEHRFREVVDRISEATGVPVWLGEPSRRQ